MSQLLQKLTAGKGTAALTADDVTEGKLDEAKLTALAGSTVDRRTLQDAIDDWLRSHADASHLDTRRGLSKLRDSIALNPLEHALAEGQEVKADPQAYLEKTAQNASKMVEREVEYYKGNATGKEKAMRALSTAFKVFGLFWIADKFVLWGKGSGTLGKIVRGIGLAGLGAWIVNNAQRIGLTPPASAAPSPAPSAPVSPASPPTPAGTPAAPTTSATPTPPAEAPITEGPELFALGSEMTIGGQTCSIVRKAGSGILSLDTDLLQVGGKVYDAERVLGFKPLSQITSIRRIGKNLLINGNAMVPEAVMAGHLRTLATSNEISIPLKIEYSSKKSGKVDTLDLTFVKPKEEVE